MTEFNTLILSGGSVKGISILGVLEALSDKKEMDLDKIQYFVGTSIGSVLSYLLIIGYKPLELMNYLCSCDLFEELGKIDISTLSSGAIFKYSIFNDHLEHLTIEKIGKFQTLKSLKELTGKTLTCVTYSFLPGTIGQQEFLNPDTNPDLPVLVALRMSCNIPLIFGTYKYDHRYFIDGGIIDNFPVLYYKNDPSKKVLAINLGFEKPCPVNFEKNIFKFVIYLVSIPLLELEKKRIEECQGLGIKIITLLLSDISIVDFSLSVSQIMDIFSRGYQKGKEII